MLKIRDESRKSGSSRSSGSLSSFLLQYFGLDILLLIGAGVGAYFVFTGQLDVLKEPFMEALRKYDDTSNVASDKTLVSAWDAFQQDVRHFKIIFNCSDDILSLKSFVVVEWMISLTGQKKMNFLVAHPKVG